jgi:hypothetical protein
MNIEERKKIVKHRLIDMGISFREWCRRSDVSHSIAKDIIDGRLNGSRGEASRSVMLKILEDFGSDIF